MNGYSTGNEAFEALEQVLEDIESDEHDESDESDERRRSRSRRNRKAPQTPTGQGLYKQRPATGPVTQVQLQAAMARVGAQIKTNADAVKALNTRVSNVTDQLDKEAVLRKKETDTLKRELRQTREMSAILPLLSRPKTVTITRELSPELPAQTKLVVDKDDTFAMLLPMLLLSGSGSGGGGLMGGGGEGDNSMMLMMLALTAGK